MCRISIAPFPLPKPAMAVTVMYRQSEAKAANAVRTIPRRAFGGRASSFLRTPPFKPSIRVFNFDRYPYEARTYARQMIIRESNVTERTLVTACRLLNASRSDDNPNGFTIEGFTVLENKDIRTIER